MITGLRSRRSAAREACGNGFGQTKRPSSIVAAELVNFAHHQVAILKQTIYALKQTYGFPGPRGSADPKKWLLQENIDMTPTFPSQGLIEISG
jgi:hypothetical protein